MTNIYRIGTLTDEQNGAPIGVELGQIGDGFHFSFGNTVECLSLREAHRLKGVLESVAVRLDIAHFKQRECKPGKKQFGLFEIGLDRDAGFYLRVLPSGRFTYLNGDALAWLIAAMRSSLAPPPQPPQGQQRASWEFFPEWAK